jgi:hypothetical protein
VKAHIAVRNWSPLPIVIVWTDQHWFRGEAAWAVALQIWGVDLPRCRYIVYLLGNRAVWSFLRVMLTYVVNEESLGQFESPARASPRFCGDTRTKTQESSFKLIQRFAVPIHHELITCRSEEKISIKEHNSFTPISDKFSVLGYRIACRGA